MNKAELVDCLDGEDTFRHVELGYILGEGVVLDQPKMSRNRLISVPFTPKRSHVNAPLSYLHSHQISTGEELHNQVQVVRVLKRVVELDDPRRVGFGEYVSLGSNVGQLGEF